MHPLLPVCVLAGLAATLGMCQETNVTPEPVEPNGRSMVGKLLKNPKSQHLFPLTREQQFHLYVDSTYGIGSTLSAATAAAFEQSRSTPSEWKQGSEGYRKRFLSAYGTHLVQGSIEYGASALLHEDNRYRPSLDTGVWRRSKHAILSAFASTDEAGHQHFSYSRVGAAGGTAFIRRTWQPSSRAGIGETVGTVGITLSARVGRNVLAEFRPELTRRLLRSKK